MRASKSHYESVKPYLATASMGGETYYLGLYRTLSGAKSGARKHQFTQQIEEQIKKDINPIYVKDGTEQNQNWYEAVVKTKMGKITYVISRENIR